MRYMMGRSPLPPHPPWYGLDGLGDPPPPPVELWAVVRRWALEGKRAKERTKRERERGRRKQRENPKIR